MFRAIAEADRWTKLSYADRHPAGMALVALGILDSALDPLEKSQLLNSDIQYVMDALRKIEGAHDRAWSNFLLAEIEDKWKPVKHVALMAELARQARMSEEDRQAWIQYRTSLM
ncbi:MAG TPA: hypothetical protein VHA82_14265 [Ramlibacter sp.]|uniref:hypothetical protein n=1 Tax=Ramlibacter sp. TaxID=1917967 RepID=UPI002CFB14CC|nr:hypothetical protein [Ramlibacter sp.]HVZ44972.1 hypothetical protein [Ramlibacter sp.]